MKRSSSQAEGFLFAEPVQQRDGLVARVAMLQAVDREYSFAIPEGLAERVRPGKRVVVPFGKKGRPRPGFCVAVSREGWSNTLKPVLEVLDEERLLDEGLIELGRWISRYYCCPLGRTLAAMVPEAIRRQSGFRTVRVVRRRVENSELRIEKGGQPGDGVESSELRIEKGDAEAAFSSDDCRSPVVESRSTDPECRLPNADCRSSADSRSSRLSSQARAVLDILAAAPEGVELAALIERAGVGRGVIAGLVKRGLVEVEERKVPAAAPDFDRPRAEPVFHLSSFQQSAIARINAAALADAFRVVLLFGPSGSGKTEIYIHSIRAALARGRQAIFLVPEIALTTQLVDRLASRFEDVAVIHSGLTGVQRSLTWAAIARGEKRVVIGTRSAIFAPCPALGLIVVDEEQEGSYKNQQSPRFHTRDVAIKRAQMAGIPVVLGSATPSLETWHNSERLAHFERITLPGRIASLPMPEVEFVDMEAEGRQRRGVHLLSRVMEERLDQTLRAGRQAVLLLNRRGYASYLVCSVCRTSLSCPNCRSNLVFHQTSSKAICHYCNAKVVVGKRCPDPSCGGTLIHFGMGTQRVEEEVKAKFPEARVARADSDALTHARHYEEVMRAFAAREVDVLVGTQMIAKGLDFPYVAFVGVVNADTSLAMPDFRAAERTFQMVTQVAGRAGRAEAGGRVVVQSLMGVPKALEFAARHDYEGFAAVELAIRRQVGWPPFSRLARVVVSNEAESEARAEAERIAEAVRGYLAERKLPADVLGPQTAAIPRMKRVYRYDLLIRAASASGLLETLDRLRNDKVLAVNAKGVLIDVDPVSLL